MGIESPISYGDHYWNASLQAQKIIAEQTEKEMAALAAGVMGSLGVYEYLPDEFQSLFKNIEAPAGAFLGDIGGRFVSEIADGAVSKAASPLFESMGYKAYMRSPTKKMTIPPTATLFARKKITEDLFFERFRMGGFEPTEAKFQYDSMRPFPSIPDLMLWARYHGDPENVWSTLVDLYDIDPVDYPKWEWLGLQRLTTGIATKLFRRNKIERLEFDQKMKQIGWRGIDIDHVLEDSWLHPNAMLIVQADLMAEVSDEQIILDISKADIHPDYAEKYLDAVLTKPSSQDIIAYELRQNPDLSDLDARLRKIGIHSDYTDVYRTLAYQIPPVADIITMAVREAFTPDIAARFGQYDDYPEELTEWGQKKGLSEDWTKRYWAAHWGLPSPQQGFEMLHRGIIDQDELNMLLRALDVMPYWRSRLTAMAYRPLTRVDVRRMYKEGILDEAGVYDAYLDHGYSAENAERMTQFTIRYVLSQQSKFTTTDVIAAFTKRMISRSDAYGMLDTMGIRSNDISYIISTAEYKRQWAFTESKISGIRNLYKRAVYDKNKTIDELSKLNLPAEQVNVLMEQWWYEDKTIPTANWTKAETLRFIKAGTITRDRGMQELRELGFDAEHISVYLGAVT